MEALRSSVFDTDGDLNSSAFKIKPLPTIMSSALIQNKKCRYVMQFLQQRRQDEGRVEGMKKCKEQRKGEKGRKLHLYTAQTHTHFNLSSFSGRTISSASMKCGTNT
jgi:hypothetical protein